MISLFTVFATCNCLEAKQIACWKVNLMLFHYGHKIVFGFLFSDIIRKWHFKQNFKITSYMLLRVLANNLSSSSFLLKSQKLKCVDCLTNHWTFLAAGRKPLRSRSSTNIALETKSKSMSSKQKLDQPKC